MDSATAYEGHAQVVDRGLRLCRSESCAAISMRGCAWFLGLYRHCYRYRGWHGDAFSGQRPLGFRAFETDVATTLAVSRGDRGWGRDLARGDKFAGLVGRTLCTCVGPRDGLLSVGKHADEFSVGLAAPAR